MKNKTYKYSSCPVFKTLSWAITYHYASDVDYKFAERCDGYDAVVYPYNHVCDDDGIEPETIPEWEILEEVTMDGVTYGRFLLTGHKESVMCWSALTDVSSEKQTPT